MLLYYLKYRKNTESKNPKNIKAKNGRIMLLSNSVVCNSKKSRFIKEVLLKICQRLLGSTIVKFQ